MRFERRCPLRRVTWAMVLGLAVGTASYALADSKEATNETTHENACTQSQIEGGYEDIGGTCVLTGWNWCFDGIGCLCERGVEYSQPGDPTCAEPGGCVTEICSGPGNPGAGGWEAESGCEAEEGVVYDHDLDIFVWGTRRTCNLGEMLGGSLLDFCTEMGGEIDLTIYDVAEPDHSNVRCLGPGLQIDCYFSGSGPQAGLGSPSFEDDQALGCVMVRETPDPTSRPADEEDTDGPPSWIGAVTERTDKTVDESRPIPSPLIPSPDLRATIEGLTVKCLPKRKKCRVKGSVVVYNDGGAPSERTFLDLYVSADDRGDESDRAIKRLRVKKLNPGELMRKTVRRRLSAQVLESQPHLFGVLDGEGTVAESRDQNNVFHRVIAPILEVNASNH